MELSYEGESRDSKLQDTLRNSPRRLSKDFSTDRSLRFLLRLSLVIFFVFVCGHAYAQSAKEAVMALKRLEARVQAGISYRDYGPALGEAKFPVNMYIESLDAKKTTELSGLIEKTMFHYEQAAFVWKEKIKGPYRYLDYNSVDPKYKELYKASVIEQNFFRQLVEEYPEANKFIKDGGALDTDASDKGKDINNLKYGRVLNLNYLFPMIWKRASQDLNKASILLNKEATKAADDTEMLKKKNQELAAENERLKAENEGLKKLSPRKGR